ncbi:MAG: J domain-containing protein [Spirochaetaceae bacterium]|nr:MAG: J domain-containing protein [Spirochaetaceae bacterium]
MSFTSRFEDFVRLLVDEHDHEHGTADRARFGGYTFDPDYAEAMQDLEYFIRHGFERPGGEPPRRGRHRADEAARMPVAVRRAFRALEVSPGAQFDAVTRAYKRLIAEYHPDRHAADPARAEAATEVSKRLNLAYRAVRDYYLVIGRIDP